MNITPLLDALKVIFELRFVRSSELLPGMYVETKYDFWKIPAVPTLKRFFQNYFLTYCFCINKYKIFLCSKKNFLHRQ